eukprot:2360988-Pyramimonas_sp.AAC.2
MQNDAGVDQPQGQLLSRLGPPGSAPFMGLLWVQSSQCFGRVPALNTASPLGPAAGGASKWSPTWSPK